MKKGLILLLIASVSCVQAMGKLTVFDRGRSLLECAGAGDLPGVKRLLNEDAKISVNFQYKGQTALSIAASKGHLSVVAELIWRGANCDLGQPICQAAGAGHWSIVQALIHAGANINVVCDRKTVLSIAVFMHNLPMVLELLEYHANPNLDCPLCQSNDLSITQALIRAGAVVNAVNEEGNTALSRAALAGNLPIVQELLEHHADPNLACPLCRAAGVGDLPVVRAIIGAGADVNTVGRNGETALSEAATMGHRDIVRELMSHEVNIDLGAPILWAVIFNHLPIVMDLINAGVNINVTDSNNKTALMQAAGRGYLPIVRALVTAGADSTLRSADGKTAHTYAVEAGHREIANFLANLQR